MSQLKSDTEARRVARTEFRRPVVLRAGAGTGKTAALVARVVAWVTGEGWNRSVAALKDDASSSVVAGRTLQRVVAITFTEAAAAEMAERIAVALHALTIGNPVTGMDIDALDAQATVRARALLPAVDQLEVRTIHAWCRNILAQFPLEARIHPNFEVDASGDVVAGWVRSTVEAQMSAALAGDRPEVILGLLGRDISPTDIEMAVQELVSRAIEVGDESKDPFNINELNAFWLRARDAVTRVLLRISGAFDGEKKILNGKALLKGLTEFRGGLVPGASIDDVKGLLAVYLPKNLRNHLVKAWIKDGGGKAESAAIAPFVTALSAEAQALVYILKCIEGLDAEGYQLAKRLVLPAVSEVQDLKRCQGVLGFSDLLVRAARLLKTPKIAERVRARIDQLLVDEFQDTDPGQCDIVRAIALQGELGLRPGLFLVGDPKQSIYGWRSADLGAYEDFVSEVLAAGGVEHGLIQNFRSTSNLLSEVDRCMEGLLLPIPGIQPSHEALVAARGPGGDDPPVEIWVSWPWENGSPQLRGNAQPARLIEASALAADIVRLHGEGVCFSEIGVLFRSSTALHIYQRALRDAGIPYEVTRDRNYYKRREVVEAIAMIRAVLDPVDTLALVSFLRSDMVGVPDAALLPLWAGGFPQAWADLQLQPVASCVALIAQAKAQTIQVEAHVDGLNNLRDWATRLTEVVERVAQLRKSFLEMPADLWVEHMRTALLPDVLGAVAYQGAYRVANLEQLFRVLCGQIELCEGDVRSVIRGLRDAISREREAEESRPSGKRSAVQMMTIHKSKGLAFTHTYLVDLHHAFMSSGASKKTTVDQRHGIQIAGLWPPSFDQVWARSQRIEEAERVRLLYVAMTRARDRLVLMGAWPETLRSLNFPRSIIDLLGARTPGLPDAQVLAQTLSPDQDQVDIDQIRWVFPGKLGRVAPAPVAGGSDSGASVLAATPLTALKAAEHRQGRRWSMGPSATSDKVQTSAKGPPLAQTQRRCDTASGVTKSKVAKGVGTAIHQLIEDVANGAGDCSDKALDDALRCAFEGGAIPDEANERARELRDVFEGGELSKYLQLVEVLGTEVSMILRADDEGEGPVGAWAGSIDLLYRCPSTGKVVVADYKTDRLAGRSAEDVAAHHAPQGRIYATAVKNGLGLDEFPVFEVWLVESDQRVVVT